MIWATINSWSCFHWLYRASSSLPPKDIINLILVFTIWWCPHLELSLLLLEDSVCNDQCVLFDKNWLAFALLHFVLQSQTCLFLLISLDSLLFHSNPMMKRTSFLGVRSRRSCKSSASLALLVGTWLGVLWYWIVCLGNEQRSFCRFEIASKNCISGSFVDCDGYSISSKVFLPIVVDIMVIWIKFARSSPF